MKSGTAFAAALVALTSFPIFPILAQQPAMHPGTQTGNPAAQQTPQAAMPQNAPAAPQETVAMSPVNGALESKLDSKTAKTGDNIVVTTETTIKTADGTEIPKGSKLMGHVIAVKASQAGTTSQVALQFDHVELKGGQSLAVHTQIQSIAPAGATEQASTPMSARAPTGSSAAAGTPGSSSSPNSNPSSNPSMGGARASAASPAASSAAGTAASPQDASGTPGTAAPGSDAPAPGTVVAQNGNIAIQTTSIPGVLLANNAPGQQDPRMASASSILLGAKQDIQLDGGTQMVVGVAAAGGGTR
jgi:hypothetical protein